MGEAHRIRNSPAYNHPCRLQSRGSYHRCTAGGSSGQRWDLLAWGEVELLATHLLGTNDVANICDVILGLD